MATRAEVLDAAVEAVALADREQRCDADPCHEDFYSWGWALSDLTAQLAGIANLLARQVEHYPDRFVLRDDQGADPAQRIEACVGALTELTGTLRTAEDFARLYHQGMSHIAVEDDREDQ